MYELFGQDAWKVTSKLHIDYGLRVTILTPYKPAWGNAVYFDPASLRSRRLRRSIHRQVNVILGTGNPYTGMVIPGFSSFPSSAAAHGVVGSGT